MDFTKELKEFKEDKKYKEVSGELFKLISEQMEEKRKLIEFCHKLILEVGKINNYVLVDALANIR